MSHAVHSRAMPAAPHAAGGYTQGAPIRARPGAGAARPPAAGALARWRVGFEEALLAAGLAANLAVALLARHFPYQDAPNHLARYTLMSRFWAGEATPGIDVHLFPGPYVALDLVGVALVRTVGARATGTLLAVLAIAAVPCGMYLLLRAVAWERRGWALAGVLFGFSWFLLAGMINYSVAVGGALAWLGVWWPRRAVRSTRVRLALVLAVAALYVVHLVGPLIVLAVVWVDYALGAVPGVVGAARQRAAGGRALGAALADAARRPQLATALACTCIAGLLWLWTLHVQAGVDAPPTPAVYRSLGDKLLAFGAAFYSFSYAQAGVMAAAYAATLLAFVRVNRAALRFDTFTASAALFLALFVVFPKDARVSGLDIRWLIPAYLLPFCVATPAPAGAQRGAQSRAQSRAQRRGLAVALVGCLAHAGVVAAYARDFDARLDAYDAVLRRVPRGTRLLALLLDRDRYPRVGPYMQYVVWHVVDGRGEAPGLFSVTPLRDEPPYPHLRHFVVRRRSYTPEPGADGAGLPAIDWRRVAADYDHLVLVDPAQRAGRAVGARACEVARAGVITLYRVGCRPAESADDEPGAPAPGQRAVGRSRGV